MEEHKQHPFTYKDKTLYLDYENTVPHSRTVLQVTNLTGGEQHLWNQVFEGWEDKITHLRVGV